MNKKLVGRILLSVIVVAGIVAVIVGIISKNSSEDTSKGDNSDLDKGKSLPIIDMNNMFDSSGCLSFQGISEVNKAHGGKFNSSTQTINDFGKLKLGLHIFGKYYKELISPEVSEQNMIGICIFGSKNSITDIVAVKRKTGELIVFCSDANNPNSDWGLWQNVIIPVNYKISNTFYRITINRTSNTAEIIVNGISKAKLNISRGDNSGISINYRNWNSVENNYGIILTELCAQ